MKNNFLYLVFATNKVSNECLTRWVEYLVWDFNKKHTFYYFRHIIGVYITFILINLFGKRYGQWI